jgi:hypothetical protein
MVIISILLAGCLAKNGSEISLGHFLFRDLYHGNIYFPFGRLRIHAVKRRKHERSSGASSLVGIDESLSFSQMKRLTGCDVENIPVCIK